jgi:hypothetical protein
MRESVAARVAFSRNERRRSLAEGKVVRGASGCEYTGRGRGRQHLINAFRKATSPAQRARFPQLPSQPSHRARDLRRAWLEPSTRKDDTFTPSHRWARSGLELIREEEGMSGGCNATPPPARSACGHPPTDQPNCSWPASPIPAASASALPPAAWCRSLR